MLFGVPLHPLLVHAPIGLLLFATLLLFFSLKWVQLKLFALITLFTGLLAGVAAYLSGDETKDYARSTFNATRAAIEDHEHFALYSLIAFGISFVLLTFNYRSNKKMLLIFSLIVAVIGSGLLAYAGHLGGQIVYK